MVRIGPAAVNRLMSRTLHKATAKQPLHRFSGAREFGEVLKTALRNEPIECFDRPGSNLASIERRKPRAKGITGSHWTFSMSSTLKDISIRKFSCFASSWTRPFSRNPSADCWITCGRACRKKEYPLALQKFQEILEVAAQQVDALQLEAEIEHR